MLFCLPPAICPGVPCAWRRCDRAALPAVVAGRPLRGTVASSAPSRGRRCRLDRVSRCGPWARPARPAGRAYGCATRPRPGARGACRGACVCVHVQARPRFLSTLKPYCTLTLKKPLARASTCFTIFTIFTITTILYCTFFYITFYLRPSPGPPPVQKLTAIMRNVRARTFRAAIPGGAFFGCGALKLPSKRRDDCA